MRWWIPFIRDVMVSTSAFGAWVDGSDLRKHDWLRHMPTNPKFATDDDASQHVVFPKGTIAEIRSVGDVKVNEASGSSSLLIMSVPDVACTTPVVVWLGRHDVNDAGFMLVSS